MARPLTHMLEPKEHGNAKGTCIVCGTYTEKGFPLKKLPQTFIDYYRLFHGSVVCPHCWMFLRDQRFRRKPWVLMEREIVFLDSRKKVHDYIASPPSPPYAIYIPLAGKKHGWLDLVHRGVNTSREIITVGTEDYTVTFHRRQYMRLHTLVKELLKRGAKKTWIQHTTINPRLYTIAPRELVDELRQWAGTRLLHLALLLA